MRLAWHVLSSDALSARSRWACHSSPILAAISSHLPPMGSRFADFHNDGTINLFELTGYLFGLPVSAQLAPRRGRLRGFGCAQSPLHGDIDAFLRGDPTPPFRVYTQSTQVFTRYLEVARRKAQQLGIRLYWRPFGEIEITRPTRLPDPSATPCTQRSSPLSGGSPLATTSPSFRRLRCSGTTRAACRSDELVPTDRRPTRHEERSVVPRSTA